MAWVTGGSIRFNVPDPVTGSSGSFSARIAGRQAQGLPTTRLPGAHSIHQRAAARSAPRYGKGRLPSATSIGAESCSSLQTLRPDLEAAFDQGSSLDPFTLPDASLLEAQQRDGTSDSSDPERVAAHAHASTSGQGGSAAAAAAAPCLPDELYRLADPAAPVLLPPTNSVLTSEPLDNRQLDKLIAALGRNKATWRRALLLYEWLRAMGHGLDDRLCTTLIRVCAEHGQAVSALAVYDWMRAPAEHGGAALSPTVYTYTAAMRAALASGMLERSLAVWEDAQAARCRPDCRLCISYIEACSRLGLTDRALAMYTQMRTSPAGSRMSPTVHAFTAAMRAATEGGRWRTALDIWSDMEAASCAPTGHAFAAAISACAAGQDWRRAVQLFEDMCSQGIRPDVVSCTALVTALAAAKQWQRSESVVRWMLSSGLKPNVRTYTALLTALGNANQLKRAVEMLQLMQTPAWGSVQPNAYTYSALLKALGDNGHWMLAEQVFSQLEREVLLSTSASNSSGAISPGSSNGLPASPSGPPSPSSEGPPLMWASGPSRLFASANDMINAAWPMHASPGSAAAAEAQAPGGAEAAAAAAPAAGSPGQADGEWASAAGLHGLDLSLDHSLAGSMAFSLFSDAPSPPSSTPVCPAPSPSAAPRLPPRLLVAPQPPQPLELASLAAVTAQPRLAPAAAPATSAASAKPKLEPKLVNEVVCGALMQAYEQGGRWEEAVGVLTRARALGVEPNTIMLNTALSAAGKAGHLELAEALFAQVRSPDTITYETMIAAYGMAGNPVRAEALFTQMGALGLRPRDYGYCGLIAGYSLSGNWQAALRVRQRMKQDRIPITVHVCNALIAACERSGQYERALELYRSMRRDGPEPNASTNHLMASIGQKGAASVEGQQVAAAALSAMMAAAGGMLIRTGMF